ncbi:MAG: hypothetical protein U0804_20155 [Gemmataceae bacterium]
MADATAPLWPNTTDAFFRKNDLRHVRQVGLTCVATSLAMVAGTDACDIAGSVNTQDPVSWSAALGRFGMKLAYLPTDVRKLRYYIRELVKLDDLFVIGFYTPFDPAAILADPQPDGWVCGSHLVVLHRGRIHDPLREAAADALEYDRLDCHTKRVFRVVPVRHPRGL